MRRLPLAPSHLEVWRRRGGGGGPERSNLSLQGGGVGLRGRQGQGRRQQGERVSGTGQAAAS